MYVKAVFSALKAFLYVAVALYLMVSFISVETNPLLWNIVFRLVVTILLSFWGALVMTTLSEVLKGIKNKK